MDPAEAERRLSALSEEIALRYGARGTLAQQVRKLGRTLPRYERGRAAELVRVEKTLGHAKLQRQIDSEAFARAETALAMHLEKVAPGSRLKGRALDISATVLFNVLLALVLLFLFVRYAL